MEFYLVLLILVAVGIIWYNQPSQARAAELQAAAAISSPIIISARHPLDRDLYEEAEKIRKLLEDSGNKWIKPTDVHIIPFKGVHNGKSLIGLNWAEYIEHVHRTQLAVLASHQERIHQINPTAADRHINGQKVTPI